MKQYVVDTNALISFVTDRNPAQQEQVAGLFDRAARLELRVLCPQNVITEFVSVMDTVYGVSPDRIKTLLRAFVSMAGTAIVHELDYDAVLSLWPDTIPDFGDAVVASVCRAIGNATLVTFDKRLIRRVKALDLAVAS